MHSATMRRSGSAKLSIDPEKIVLKPQHDGDMPFLEALYASTRWEEMQVTGWKDQEIKTFLSSQFQAQSKYYQEYYKDSSFDIIYYNETPVGRLYLQERKNEFRIVDIALMPDHRGKGLGSYLLEKVFQKARSSGKMVCIHVEHNNPAMNLYKRLGFKKVEDVGVYHLMEWRP